MKNFIRLATANTLSIFLIGTILNSGCSKKKQVTPVAVPVLVAQAVTTNVPVLIDPPPVGHVTPIQTVMVRAQIGGTISQIHFNEGQEVKAGDLLFTIDPRPSQAALEQARANLQRDTAQLQYAKVNFAREQKLYDQKLISRDELDTNHANMNALVGTVAADEAAVSNAVLNVEFCDIRAPIDGRTGGLQFNVGNVVKAPDDVLITINQLHPIYVAFAVPERFLPEIQQQQNLHPLAVTVSFENMTGAAPHGEVSFIDNTVDEMTGTIGLKATFANTNGQLWPGQFVEMNLTLSELTNVVVVPSQAVQVSQKGQLAYVVKADKTVEARAVKSSITFDGKSVIESGVQAGETVVTDGQLRLLPGVKVSFNPTNAPAAAANQP